MIRRKDKNNCLKFKSLVMGRDNQNFIYVPYSTFSI